MKKSLIRRVAQRILPRFTYDAMNRRRLFFRMQRCYAPCFDALAILVDKKAEKTICFIHLPKCAGSTVSRHIRNANRFTPWFVPLCMPELQDDYSTKQQRPHLSCLTHRRYLSGHLNYGIHTRSTHPVSYVIILRDPVAMMESLHFYRPETKNVSIIDVLKHPENYELDDRQRSYNDNAYVRQLSGVGMHASYGSIGTKHLELAKQNLKNCDLVGIYENYHEFIRALEKYLGAHINQSLRLNARKAHSCFSDDERMFVRNHVALDIKLYEYARTIAEERFRSKQSIQPRQGIDA